LAFENCCKHWIINLLAFFQNNICCSHELIVRVYLDVFNGEHNRIIFIILVFDYLSFILVFNLIDSLIDLKLDRPWPVSAKPIKSFDYGESLWKTIKHLCILCAEITIGVLGRVHGCKVFEATLSQFSLDVTSLFRMKFVFQFQLDQFLKSNQRLGDNVRVNLIWYYYTSVFCNTILSLVKNFLSFFQILLILF
jgi:hypothetical protein